MRDNAGNYPVYSSQTANNGQIGKIATFDFDGEYLTWTTDGANAGTIFYRNGKFSVTNVCGLLKATSNKIDPKFAYYILSVNMKNHVSSGMGNPKLMSNVVEKIKIPIPPLAIQEEIVNILDTFTTLKAELEAELEARKKQYTFYRDSLLSFEGKDVEWKTLGEISKFRRGSFPQPYGKSDWYDGEEAMPFVQVADVGSNLRLVQNTKQKISKLAQPKSVFVPTGTVIVTLQGSIGRVAITDYDSYVDRTLAIFESFSN